MFSDGHLQRCGRCLLPGTHIHREESEGGQAHHDAGGAGALREAVPEDLEVVGCPFGLKDLKMGGFPFDQEDIGRFDFFVMLR